LERALLRLVELELVAPQPGGRFPEEEEYLFRHALVRDAAYALVPDSHKPTGHQRAAEWLERRGEGDPQVLAHHLRLGPQPQRAIPFYAQAAEQLFVRHDMEGLARCMEAALALGPTGEPLVQLRALRATAAFWMDDFATLYEVGSAVLLEVSDREALELAIIENEQRTDLNALEEAGGYQALADEFKYG
jgi:hypothetical protein